MNPPDSNTDSKTQSRDQGFEFAASPTVSLPKGGGAIRGIDEKFQVNPATGTGSLNIPIFTSPGRQGFGPQLALSYDSGAGNGPFGLGWNLTVPHISRKTDKGIPRYWDAEESDTFVLTGAEDLVPILTVDGRRWQDDSRVTGYRIHRYRPRTEGLFARVERWTRLTDGDVHWCATTPANITSIYGRSPNCRITDPEDERRTFCWLLEETYDDKGNITLYQYKQEDNARVSPIQPQEKNRLRHNYANHYIKRVFYGNTAPFFPNEVSFDRTDWERDNQWHFQVVFDFGEHHPTQPTPEAEPGQLWALRPDGFSQFRAGFEIRTQRLCQRALMFHNFPEEPGFDGRSYLVRSTDFVYEESPIVSYLVAVSQSGYMREADITGYAKRSLPPVEFTYTRAEIDETVRTVAPGSLANLPIGLDGARYRWVDLDGEGISGFLTEQGGTWFYKRNLGNFDFSAAALTLTHPPAPPVPPDAHIAESQPPRFAPLRVVKEMPSLANGHQPQPQLMDLAGDGQLDLVLLGGAIEGFFERDKETWRNFRPFPFAPQVNWNDPNLRLVDLNGDGHADILISENDVFTWYPSRAEAGFGPAEFAHKAADEEQGPTLVLADATQSVYLADMAGDGLSAIVRIHNGEICYWPNLGYGRFGAKVTMGDAPLFDLPDQFDQRRIRLADIDGSGTTDILYLGRQGVDIYFNQAGNSWAARRHLSIFPQVDNLSAVTVADLLGNGTACLVWSSPLPGDAHQPLRYVDLMNGIKPHLLTRVVNNMGAETVLTYAPSTKFYLADEQAGRPWITRLAFPVHVVESVEFIDHISQTRYVSHYRYHHGYYDGPEREFRGFGLVEQWDSDLFPDYDRERPSGSPHAGEDTLHQPPVYSKSWFHTGAYSEDERISHQYITEYYGAPQADDPHYEEALRTFTATLLPDTLLPEGLTAEERPEAVRALRGQLLRQEVYAIDGDEAKQGHPYTVTEQNFLVRQIQSRLGNRHAVFLSFAHEAISYHYERNPADPRVTHAFTLDVDDFGNVTRMAAVAYPRRLEGPEVEPEQRRLHITCTEADFTNEAAMPGFYLVGVPYQARSYEVTGVTVSADRLFTWEEIDEQVRLAAEIAYEATPTPATIQKRLLSQTRNRYFAIDLATPLPLGQVAAPLLPFEIYQAVFSDDYLADIFSDRLPLPALRDLLAGEGGYVFTDGLWWLHSGRQEYAPASLTDLAARQAAAQANFYLPLAVVDVFSQRFTIAYDSYHLFPRRTEDPLHNIVQAVYDYRVLQPWQVTDPNGNRSQAAFDVLGMVVGTAVMSQDTDGDGLPDKGDSLVGFRADLDKAEMRRYLDAADPRTDAHLLLANATTRLIYDVWRYYDTKEESQPQPNVVWTLARETHASEVAEGEATAMQHSFLSSDGLGHQILTKAQAEPGPLSHWDSASGQWQDTWAGPGEVPFAPRWVGNGRTLFNNKGKPVKQYEPFFAGTHRYQSEAEVVMQGVTPIIHYDPLGRVIRTDNPDGTFSHVAFDPWQQTTWDANDTVLESDWYAARMALPDIPENQAARRAAALAAAHADTPATVLLDTLARPFLALADNNDNHLYRTHTTLDISGQPLWITDDRGNRVMVYQREISLPSGEIRHVCGYDMAGRSLFQNSMDAGQRWALPNVAGKPFYAWDVNERIDTSGTMILEHRVYYTQYDPLQRPLQQWLKINDADTWQVTEQFIYGEGQTDDQVRNLRGQVYQHYDPSGLMTNERFDFKGNLHAVTRRLTSVYAAPVIDWTDGAPVDKLEDDSYVMQTAYDALNRMIRQENWQLSGRTPAVYEPTYNARGLLQSENLTLNGSTTTAISHLTYDAKGQRQQIRYGNGTLTRYRYDPFTFRLEQLRTTRPDYNPTFPNYHSNLRDERVLQQLNYTYDPTGNITEIYDEAYEPIFFRNQRVEPRSQYTYDALYRLIEATGRENREFHEATQQFEHPPLVHPIPRDVQALRNYSQVYSYDAVGNIHQMRHVADDGSWTRTYEVADDSNRLLRTSTNNPIETVDYHYDSHGSMLNLANVSADHYIRWDYRDMIHIYNLGGGGWAYYNYDAGKQRTRKRIERNGSTVEERLYLGGMERYRRWRGARLVEEIETHHLFAADQRVLMVEDVLTTDNPHLGTGTLYRYQYGNHLGSACLELDDSTAIISYEEYHPYGTSAYQFGLSAAEVSLKRYHYTGMEQDEETGLSYHTARYYAPCLGRWCSADPKGTADGANLFRYAGNRPLVEIDQQGTQATIIGQLGTSETEREFGLGLLEGLGDIASGALSSVQRTVDAIAENPEYLALGPEIGVVAAAIGGNGPYVAAEIRKTAHESRGAGEFAAYAEALNQTFNPARQALMSGERVITATREGNARQAGRHTLHTAVAAISAVEPLLPRRPLAQSAGLSVSAAESHLKAVLDPPAPLEPAALSAESPALNPSHSEVVSGAAVEIIDEAALRVEITERTQVAVTQAQDRLDQAIMTGDSAYLDELLVNSRGTSPRTQYLLQTDQFGNPIPSARFYGQAMELQFKRQIQADPILSEFISPGETLRRQLPSGRVARGFTDATFSTSGTYFPVDLTTAPAAAAHYARFYGENMLVLTYRYPF